MSREYDMKETSKSNEGVSRMVLEETNGQLKRSENRIIELRERIKELSVNANENEESMNMEELRKKRRRCYVVCIYY